MPSTFLRDVLFSHTIKPPFECSPGETHSPEMLPRSSGRAPCCSSKVQLICDSSKTMSLKSFPGHGGLLRAGEAALSLSVGIHSTGTVGMRAPRIQPRGRIVAHHSGGKQDRGRLRGLLCFAYNSLPSSHINQKSHFSSVCWAGPSHTRTHINGSPRLGQGVAPPAFLLLLSLGIPELPGPAAPWPRSQPSLEQHNTRRSEKRRFGTPGSNHPGLLPFG